MREFPLAVAVAAVLYDNNILLIKRVKGDYVGYWSLPGGKIEKPEHVSEAAVREVFEESGLETEFRSYLGFVSEHLRENDQVQHHFMLHLCELYPKTLEITQGSEGKLQWFDLATIEQHRDLIIPSDYLMIKQIVKNRGGTYFNCVIDKAGEEYILRHFGSL